MCVKDPFSQIRSHMCVVIEILKYVHSIRVLCNILIIISAIILSVDKTRKNVVKAKPESQFMAAFGVYDIQKEVKSYGGSIVPSSLVATSFD